MSRALTTRTTLDNLRKDAKRWLKALRSGDAKAEARLKVAWPSAPAEPALRDVQHALAREYGQDSWIALNQALDDLALARKSRNELLEVILRHGWDGDAGAARRLLQRHPDLARDSLFTAATCGDVAEVERRLKADPEAARKTGGPLGWTALHFVVYGRLDETNAVDIARLLLDAGADPNAEFNDGWDSPFKVLTGAIRLGEGARPSHARVLELMELLIARGADPFDPQALYNISIVGDDTAWYDRLWACCVAAGVEGRWRRPARGLGEKKGLTALDYLLGNAVGQNQIERAEWLLERGADPNALSLYNGQPTLVLAKLSGFLEMVALLERHGAKAPPMTGVHAFQAACLAGDRAEAERLLAAAPSLIKQPQPLLSAAELGNEAGVEVLLSLGARLDAVDHDGISPLHRAAQSGSLTIVRRMVEAGADVELRERRWNGTPMSWAVVLHKPEVADYLAPLSHDVGPLAYQGRLERLKRVLDEQPERAREVFPGELATPLFVLPDDEELALEVARLLLARGADPSIRNSKGRTAADLARLNGHDEVADLIEAARVGTG
jgi:ankyrin repeat protein